tara:strand:- start:182 stop:391 length:210 start_codon:yes stop_codon:yes gene_type:complete
LNVYWISTLGGVNRRIIGSLLGVVESPNTLCNSTIVVNEFRMIATPNSNNVAFEFSNLITIILWSFVWK